MNNILTERRVCYVCPTPCFSVTISTFVSITVSVFFLSSTLINLMSPLIFSLIHLLRVPFPLVFFFPFYPSQNSLPPTTILSYSRYQSHLLSTIYTLSSLPVCPLLSTRLPSLPLRYLSSHSLQAFMFLPFNSILSFTHYIIILFFPLVPYSCVPILYFFPLFSPTFFNFNPFPFLPFPYLSFSIPSSTSFLQRQLTGEMSSYLPEPLNIHSINSFTKNQLPIPTCIVLLCF